MHTRMKREISGWLVFVALAVLSWWIARAHFQIRHADLLLLLMAPVPVMLLFVFRLLNRGQAVDGQRIETTAPQAAADRK